MYSRAGCTVSVSALPGPSGSGYATVEAPLEEAVRIFYNRFGHNPYRVSCTCCGEDYSVTEHDTLEEATEFERRNSVTLEEYMFHALKYEALFIAHEEIAEHERRGDVPVQGYVWQD